MFRLLFIALVVVSSVSCSKSVSVKRMAQDIREDREFANNYHAFYDNSIETQSAKLIESYQQNPDQTCEQINTLETKELLEMYDVLFRTKDTVKCADQNLSRIYQYYENYRSRTFINFKDMKFRSMKNGSNDSTRSISNSVKIIDRPLSLPMGNRFSGKVLNFSFDDGPHEINTPKVLATLRDYGIKANFFVMGKNTKAYPNLIKAEARDGHAIGGHSMTHRDLKKLSFEAATQEIMGSLKEIHKILGAVDPFFRFPYGSRTTSLRNFLKENNVSDFLWTIDTLDWKYKDPDVLLQYALEQTLKFRSGVVLFHDIQPQTAAILPAYFDKLSQLGYSSVVYEPK